MAAGKRYLGFDFSDRSSELGAPSHGGFGASAQGGFGASAQGGFGASAQGGFGASAQGGFGVGGGFGAPSQGGFGASAQAGFGASSSSSSAASSRVDENPNRDSIAAGAPSDTVSSLRWSPAGPFSNLLCASSWNTEVRVWDVVANTGQAVPKLVLPQASPVLCCDWQHAVAAICSGACDGSVRQLTLDASQNAVSDQLGEHAAPVKALVWNKTIHAAVTGSWDKTVAIWDPRTRRAKEAKTDFKAGIGGCRVGGLDVSDRVHAMDNREHLVAIATADRKVTLYDLRNLKTRVYDAPFLEKQSTAIAIFPGLAAFALGSIEGRVSIDYINHDQQSRSFKFKCHRQGEHDAYAINAMAVTEAHKALATAGSDGTYCFWDKDAKKRLFPSQRMSQPITALAFNHTGNILAYATGYDWAKGAENWDKTKKTQILLHGVDRKEVIPDTL